MVQLGYNAGLVLSRPLEDPPSTTFSGFNLDNGVKGIKLETLNRDVVLKEIGFYAKATPDADFEVGIYDVIAGTPTNLLWKSAPKAKGATEGWKRIDTINYTLTAGNTYCVAVALKNTTPDTKVGISACSEDEYRMISDTTTDVLETTWAGSFLGAYIIPAIYALYVPDDTGSTGSAILRTDYIDKAYIDKDNEAVEVSG